MNYYKYDIELLIRRLFRNEKVRQDELVKKIVECGKSALDPFAIASITKALREDGQLMKNISTKDALYMVGNSTSQFLWEAIAYFKGVTIIVEDRELVKAMLRTEIDALIKDVKIPFPICEFVFPSGIPLGAGDYDVSGSLLCDLSYNIKKECGDEYKALYFDSEDGAARYQFMTRLFSASRGDDRQGVSWLRFSSDIPLENVPLRVPVAEVDSFGLRQMARLVFGLCLYLQTEEGTKALMPRMKNDRRQGVCAASAKCLKKHRSYKIEDLISPKLRYEKHSRGGHHNSPKAHWRKLHMRSLRHEKFKRNEDGSVKVIWVRPSLINADKDDRVNCLRKI